MSLGRSNAFQISEKLGIPEKIINRAKDFIEDDTINIEELLTEIYKNKQLIEEEKIQIEKNLHESESLKNKYQMETKTLSKKENEIISNAKVKARDILLEAKEEANDIIKTLEKEKSNKKSNDIRRNLNKKIEDLSIAENVVNPKPLKRDDVKNGLEVNIPHLNQSGSIISNVTKDDTVMVQIGNLKLSLKLSEITLAKGNNKKPEKIVSNKRDFDVKSVSPEINVIGQNVDSACFMIDKYLDNCALNGLKNVQIIHGKGTGKLRQGIHNYLKNHPHVKSFRVGTFGEGEMGVTVVELK